MSDKAKTHLSHLINGAAAGEFILLGKPPRKAILDNQLGLGED